MSEPTPGFKLFTKSNATEGAADKPLGLSLPKVKNVRQRWLLVGVGSIVVLGAASSFLKDEPKQREKKVQEIGTVDVNPKIAAEREFTAVYSRDMELMKARMEKLDASNKAKEEQIKALSDQVRDSKNAAPAQGGSAGGVNKNPFGGTLGAPDAPPSPPVLPDRLKTPQGSTPAILPPTTQVPNMPASAMPPSMVAPLPMPTSGKPIEFKGPTQSSDGPSVDATTTFKKNENAGRIPLSFASMSLLNGIDAGTSKSTQSNPLPVLVSINTNAQLPGLAQYRMKGCFALGTGYGDMSSERVYIRVSRLSCTDKSNNRMLSSEISGYINDSDGTLGLRGKVEDRQGARLGKALLAGFAQGLAGALGTAQATTGTSSLTGAITSSITGSAALRQSGLMGAQSATNQLAEFYLKEAQNIFPVIAIENGRKGTLVITSDTKLEWTSTKDAYVPKVTPAGKRS